MSFYSYLFGFLSTVVLSPILCGATEYPDPYAPPFYDDQIVILPNWVKEEFRDINAKLRAKLSPSDYLEILKGEYHLLKDAPTRAHAIRGAGANGLAHPDKLKEKLQQILDNPDDETSFARAHFIELETNGIFFREDLRYAEADLYWNDEEYAIGKSYNGTGSHAGNCDFWNTRTCRKDLSLAIPTPCFFENSYPCRVKGTKLYEIPSECGVDLFLRYTWFGEGSAVYVVNPQEKTYLSSYAWIISGEIESYGLTSKIYKDLKKAEKYNYEHDYKNPQSSALEEIGLDAEKKTPPSVCFIPEETEYSQNARIVNSAGTGINLNLSTLHNDFITKQKITTDEPQSIIALNSKLEQILDINSDGRIVAAQRFRWHASSYTNPGNEEIAFVTAAWRRYHIGIQLSDGNIRMLPSLSSIAKTGHTTPLYSIGELGTKWTSDYVLSGEDEVEDIEVIDAQKIYNKGDFGNIQLIPQPSGKSYLFISAGKESEKNECWQLEISKDGKSVKTIRHWNYVNSKLLANYHAGLEMMFIPACNNSYWVKKLLPDGGEKDMGRLFVNPMQGYAFVLPDGRYAGSPGCEAFLGFGDGNTSVGMEALAPWRNRPAEVLKALNGNPDDVAALQQTTERWLKKQGYDINAMPTEPRLSDFAQMDVQLPPLFTTNPTLEVEVELCSAEKRAVTALEVRVDGVRISQSWDADLLVPAGQSKKLTVQVPLGFGQNWIELKPVDSLGVAGAPYRFRTIYKGKYEPNLYVVALGVSDYADDGLDLQYAAKDARDVAAAFAEYSPHRVRSLTLTDAEVTPTALEKVRGFLSSATVDDCVVLYVAGHGMLNEQLEYHYAPHGFDAERVSETGISMDKLRSCLLDSPARKRLLLLDTCHSGSVGEEDMEKLAMNGVQLPPGVRAIQNRGMKVVKTDTGLGNRNQTRRYIEEMFSASAAEDGISVLAASSGAEFAMESGECKNGIFTTALLNTLKDATVADFNKDAKLSLGELLHYIPQQVRNMTGGLQSPSVQLEESVSHFPICLAPVNSPQAMARWVDFHKRTSPLNDLSYMHEHYEPQVTNLKTGQTMSLNELMQEQLQYVSHWHKRSFDVHDFKITGNIIEIRSSYRCENAKGKTASGFCKTTYRISDNGKIDGVADDSSRERLPEFSSYAQPVGDNAPSSDLTAEKVRELVRAHLGNYSDNDLSFMRTMYEPVSTNMADGTRVDIDTMIEEHRSYITRWVKRKLELVDYAYRGNRLEIRCRFTCTNTKGKTVRGYCKTTYCYSENGLVESFADDSSTKQLPAYSSLVGEPSSL